MIAVVFTLVGVAVTVAVVFAWLPYHDGRIRAEALAHPPKGVAVWDLRPMVEAMGKLVHFMTDTLDPAITKVGEQTASEAEEYANRGDDS